MRIPISLLYDDYLELEKKIEDDPFDDPGISERYYNELMVKELEVISHPDYNDFMPHKVSYPPESVINVYYQYLLSIFDYSTMKHITMESIGYNMYLHVKYSNIFSKNYRAILHSGWEKHSLTLETHTSEIINLALEETC
jgi:hypothetical protein